MALELKRASARRSEGCWLVRLTCTAPLLHSLAESERTLRTLVPKQREAQYKLEANWKLSSSGSGKPRTTLLSQQQHEALGTGHLAQGGFLLTRFGGNPSVS